MTDETKIKRDVERFTQLVEANMPEKMSGEDIMFICARIITSYLDVEGAMFGLKTLISSLLKHYTGDDSCDCPECTGNNGPMVH